MEGFWEGEPIVPFPSEAAPVPGRAVVLPLGREGCDAAAALDAADRDDGSAGSAPKNDPARWSAHTQASLEGVLSCEQAYELLIEDSFQPGHRTPLIRKDSQGLYQTALYKECPKRRLRVEPGADRWRNSGGEKGSSFLRNTAGVQVIRRRYGTVTQADGTRLKYHEYNLVHQDLVTGKLWDGKEATLFHVLPSLDKVGQSFTCVAGCSAADVVADGSGEVPTVQPKRGQSEAGSSVAAKRACGSSVGAAVVPAVVTEPQLVAVRANVA